MELQIDVGSFLPKHQVPSFNKMVSLLTQTCPEFTKGAAMLLRDNQRGIFTIKVWDKKKGKNLQGKKIDYYPEEGKSKKKVSLVMEEKIQTKRYNNPKYLTMVGFQRYPNNQLSNDQINNILKQYGTIIEPTDDVYAEVFMTGKKKARIDLDKGKDIP